MSPFRIQKAASLRLDEIYRYTFARWGKTQADQYIEGLFGSFGKIANRDMLSRPIPAEFGVSGYFYRYEKHFVYWKYLADGQIGIVTVLHERMHQMERFRDAFGAREDAAGKSI